MGNVVCVEGNGKKATQESPIIIKEDGNIEQAGGRGGDGLKQGIQERRGQGEIGDLPTPFGGKKGAPEQRVTQRVIGKTKMGNTRE